MQNHALCINSNAMTPMHNHPPPNYGTQTYTLPGGGLCRNLVVHSRPYWYGWPVFGVVRAWRGDWKKPDKDYRWTASTLDLKEVRGGVQGQLFCADFLA